MAHCGPVAAGSFIHTLTLTDVASGWTECAALVVREATLVVEAIEQLREVMPFPLVDTDNGSEFVNETLLRYCTGNGIELTRSRPYKKNDQAWIEQKNGAVVRRCDCSAIASSAPDTTAPRLAASLGSATTVKTAAASSCNFR